MLSRKAFGTTRPAAAAAGSRASRVRICCRAQAQQECGSSPRRQLLQQSAALAAAVAILAGSQPAVLAASLQVEESKLLCNAECTAKLESTEAVSLPSGLKFKDIITGTGPSPPVGFQVVANYVAMTPTLRVFESSLDKGKPYDIRVGAGQIMRGLDEGLLTMKPGGLRRLYIPGDLAFPKGLKAAPGRPAVPPASPVVFDVQLLYIPGLEADE
ncbi:Peptidyl-prolyl cis-trans isomerase FKBP16-3, chloroplastic [Tetrabaena socialis]|uniref:peptidylprolyl isomerase n=1 Tax=Tetrabaena socialis TaxID=47790 RepID=A0A2J8AJP5_9CHLO|nr:Peptidyl-prolyl cis-trans isomerase FKBP16-3, chloroplastic [Tetrabaena socialis]|eukprot:PNH12723.1 Peptidyl-prolyl cis-trans isomerase FKBP16-3, chloroplastic [Tetrabaena socialis]